jgi:hypothetical protein
MTTYEPSRLDIQDVMPMSGYKAADIADVAMRAMNRYTIEELKSEEELPAVMLGLISVMPRRVGRTRVVFLCYKTGSLIGSMRVDTAKA